MNISHEFYNIRNAFKKVKEDMNFLSEKITENYDEFTRRHKVLAKDIENITLELKENLNKIKEVHLNPTKSLISEKELNDMKFEIKSLKKEIKDIHNNHTLIIDSMNDIKSNKKEIKSLKEKLNSSELEIFLLKERLIEKDNEIKQMKEISKHLFNIVDDLSKTELDILNFKHKKLAK